MLVYAQIEVLSLIQSSRSICLVLFIRFVGFGSILNAVEVMSWARKKGITIICPRIPPLTKGKQ